MYGEPLAVVVQALLHVIRSDHEAARELVATWREGGPGALKASHFEGLADLTGSTLADLKNDVHVFFRFIDSNVIFVITR